LCFGDEPMAKRADHAGNESPPLDHRTCAQAIIPRPVALAWSR
jgi:hypothetical protein